MNSNYKTNVPSSHNWAKLGWALGITAVVVFLVWALGNLLVPVVISLFLAYILDPIIDRFEEKGLNRTVAIVLFLALVLVFLAAFVLILIPVIQAQTEEFTRNLPKYTRRFQEFIMNGIVPWLERIWGRQLPHDWEEIMAAIPKVSAKFWPQITGSVSKTASTLLLSTRWLAALFFTIILVPVFTFYILRDFDKMRYAVMDLLPRPTYENWIAYFREIDEALASVIRGQLTVCLVLGTMYSIGLSIVGLPLGVIIGMLTGILAFIPYVGFAIGFTFAILMSLFAWEGPGLLIGVLATYGIVQLIDAVAVTPRILGGKLRVNPVIIIIALMVGGRLFGFVGVLLAAPVTGILKVTLYHIIAAYQRSPVYLGDPEPSPEPGSDGLGSSLNGSAQPTVQPTDTNPQQDA